MMFQRVVVLHFSNERVMHCSRFEFLFVLILSLVLIDGLFSLERTILTLWSFVSVVSEKRPEIKGKNHPATRANTQHCSRNSPRDGHVVCGKGKSKAAVGVGAGREDGVFATPPPTRWDSFLAVSGTTTKEVQHIAVKMGRDDMFGRNRQRHANEWRCPVLVERSRWRHLQMFCGEEARREEQRRLREKGVQRGKSGISNQKGNETRTI